MRARDRRGSAASSIESREDSSVLNEVLQLGIRTFAGDFQTDLPHVPEAVGGRASVGSDDRAAGISPKQIGEHAPVHHEIHRIPIWWDRGGWPPLVHAGRQERANSEKTIQFLQKLTGFSRSCDRWRRQRRPWIGSRSQEVVQLGAANPHP